MALVTVTPPTNTGSSRATGRERAGAPDLHVDREHPRLLLLGGELAGNGPARCTCDKTQLLLLIQPVDLEYDAVDVEGQSAAPRLHRAVIGETAFQPLHPLHLIGHPQPPVAQLFQHLAVPLRQISALDTAHAIAIDLQRTPGRDPGVELADAAGGGVARIDEGFLTLRERLRVEAFETRVGNIDLAAHFQPLRDAPPRKAQWHAFNGADIGGDVLAGDPVAAGRGPREHAVFIEQADREPVELGFGGVIHRIDFQSFPHPAVEVGQFLVAESITQREHAHLVAHLAKGLERRRADAPGG